MNQEDIRITQQRYRERYQTFGYSPKTLGWGKNGRQELRFSILTQVGDLNGKTVLDVGCGFGDLYGFLKTKGWFGSYIGIDFVDELIQEGKKRYPDAEFIIGDFENIVIEQKIDYIISSGMFNFRLETEDNWTYIDRMLRKMLAIASNAVAVDFMTSWVDYQHPIAFHADPCLLLQKISQLTRRFVIRGDYMPYEYSLYLYDDKQINSDNTY
ncbi:MAG: class I SAM-dependent methyltransferase [Candidatus Thermoplasmatota archaeon]|nr:class I SAM-dependent methyltransferase [Candidatus Thermoplasmatota archaeon]